MNRKYLSYLIIFFIALLLILHFRSQKKLTSQDASFSSSKQATKNFPLSNLIHEKNIIPVAIIGSGPAGLTAGMYTSRAKLTTVIFAGKEIGGQLTEASYVENWPAKPKMAGAQIMKELKEQAQKFGAQIVLKEVKNVDFSTWPYTLTLDDGQQVKALSVIITMGGSQKTLDVPGVKEFWGKGIGICSICDAPFDKGKDVAVIGGGDAAADRALQLSAFANKVTILVRGPVMRAAAVVQEYVKNTKNISIQYNIEIKKIIGDERVTGVEILDTKADKTTTLPLQAVYFALGFVPRSDLFKGKLDIDKEGYLKLQARSQKTSKLGVFAAGTIEDCCYQKSITAAGDGAKAGMDAIEFMLSLGFTPEFSKTVEELLYKPSVDSLEPLPEPNPSSNNENQSEKKQDDALPQENQIKPTQVVASEQSQEKSPLK